MRNIEKKGKYLFYTVLLGAISGTFVGDILGNGVSVLRFLKNTYNVGMTKPFILDLKFINLTFGVDLNVNIMTIVGIILAIIIYKKH